MGNSMKSAVILAAGRGGKIWPYCDTWPKAALPIANRAIIQWQIEALQACGVQEITVVTNHLGAQVRVAGENIPNIRFVECIANGTAAALLSALHHIQDNSFLVLYGDVIVAPEDLRSLLDLPIKDREFGALVQPLGKISSQEWLCANVAEQRVREILGHPREASHRLCGIYTLTREIIPYLENNPGFMTSVEVGNMPSAEAELAESLSQFVKRGGTLGAVNAETLFVDVDKPWHLLDANTAMLEYQAGKLRENQIAESAVIEDGAEINGFIVAERGAFIGHDVKIKGNLWIGENSRIVDGAIVGGNTSVGKNSVLREYCRIEPNSSIGNHCVVGHAAEFGGILMDGAYSYHYGEYWGVIGRSADLGAATVCGNLRFDDQTTHHVIKGRREIPASHGANAAFLGDYTRTGVNAILMPGVKIGPYSVIGAGVILNEDVPNNSLVYVKQELIRKTWGPERYGW